MSWPYRTFIRPFLFTQDPESIHGLTLRCLHLASRHEVLCDAIAAAFRPPPLPVDTLGLHFPNPIGLAAGMDKVGEAVPAWEAMGFGFSELGAVTRHAQPGNPTPRIFRLIADEALINRMGFNNAGAEAFAHEIRDWRAGGRWPRHPVGVNLGKSRVTPLDQAAQDYAASFQTLWADLDFFVVNVSSPNTPNLRQLQDRAALDEILAALQEVNRKETSRPGPAATLRPPPKPILVKVAPDLTWTALDEILELVGPRQIAGLVATNTTLARPSPSAPDPARQRLFAETGGLSGRPLRQRSTDVIRHLYRQTRGQLPLIGVGGIFTVEDAWEKITAGATLLQVYTSLVFEGPGLARDLVRGLTKRLAAEGLPTLRDAVGIATPSH